MSELADRILGLGVDTKEVMQAVDRAMRKKERSIIIKSVTFNVDADLMTACMEANDRHVPGGAPKRPAAAPHRPAQPVPAAKPGQKVHVNAKRDLPAASRTPAKRSSAKPVDRQDAAVAHKAALPSKPDVPRGSAQKARDERRDKRASKWLKKPRGRS